MSFNSKMTALADQVRTLRNTTGTLTLDQMTTGITTTNSEVNEQVDLISQIQSALEGKAAGGGAVLPTLTNPASASDILSGKEAINGDGTKITGTIATKTSSNLTASGATVTVPAGYYASQSTKSVATATQATPTVSIDANGKITASATQTAGYVSAGTKSGTKQLTTQAAKTITPSTSSQTAVAKNVYTTGAITVGAIPSNYEDVGTETSAYTAKLATLETAIAALETELQGKASGGGSGGGGAQYITGELTMSSTGVTITGLQFTPVQVIAYSNVSIYCDSVARFTNVPVFVCGGITKKSIAYTKEGNIVDVAVTSYATVTIIDNGFTIGTGTGRTGTFNEGESWTYIAFK
jgi:hypothetical protein